MTNLAALGATMLAGYLYWTTFGLLRVECFIHKMAAILSLEGRDVRNQDYHFRLCVCFITAGPRFSPV